MHLQKREVRGWLDTSPQRSAQTNE